MDSNRQLQELVLRHQALKAERKSWEADWKKLAAHFLPHKCRLESEAAGQTNKGGLRGDKLDSTAFYAMRDLAAGLHGGLTSPARPWFKLTMRNPALMEFSEVKEWLDETTKRILFAYHNSNFYTAISSFYSELGTFGTAFMFEIEDEREPSGLRFMPLTAGEYCLDVNDSGRVDTVLRSIQWTLKQLVDAFGQQNLPEQLRTMYEHQRMWNERFQVVHAVYPEASGKRKFSSIYYLDSQSGSKSGQRTVNMPFVLSRDYFDQFPGFGVRWDVTGGDVYGRGPAHDTLADSVLLQQMTASLLKALHKEIDPPLAAPPGFENISLLPGAVSPVSAVGGQGNAVYPLLNLRHNIEGTHNVITRIQDKVREGLFNNLFKMLLNSDRRQITAHEVAAREEEKLILIGPVLERLNDEFFIPLSDRTFNILLKSGRLPDPPEVFQDEEQDTEFNPEFVSILAQAQKMVSTGAVQQFAAFVSNTAQMNPEVLDAVNYDEMVNNYADYLGIEANMLRGQDERDKLRAARQKQQAAMQQMQAMQAGVGAIKDMGQANMHGSALGGLLGQGTAAALE